MASNYALGRIESTNVPRLKILRPMSAVLPSVRTPLSVRLWAPGPILDQGQTSECTAFCGRAHLNAAPFPEPMKGPAPDVLYREEKRIDNLPTGSDGSTMEALATVLYSQQLIGPLLWADDELTVRRWVLDHSPVMFGTSWYNSMFSPDADGLVSLIDPYNGVSGPEGGHAYLCIGYDNTTGLYTFQNSWGTGWGVDGFFKMSVDTVGRLMSENGEGIAALNNGMLPDYLLMIGGKH